MAARPRATCLVLKGGWHPRSRCQLHCKKGNQAAALLGMQRPPLAHAPRPTARRLAPRQEQDGQAARGAAGAAGARLRDHQGAAAQRARRRAVAGRIPHCARARAPGRPVLIGRRAGGPRGGLARRCRFGLGRCWPWLRCPLALRVAFFKAVFGVVVLGAAALPRRQWPALGACCSRAGIASQAISWQAALARSGPAGARRRPLLGRQTRSQTCRRVCLRYGRQWQAGPGVQRCTRSSGGAACAGAPSAECGCVCSG